MINIQHRDNITDMLNPGSIGCELGVFEGEFSSILLNSNKFDKLYLVDLFSGPAWNDGKHYPDSSVLYDTVKSKFCNYPEIEVVKQDSVSFLKTTPLKFDFIYIDTIHSYDHCKQELDAAHNIINNNGYICGHDYCSEFRGVIEAVIEFSKKYQYTPIITQEQKYPSFIIKTKICN
jgi:hypothetical protein